MPTKPMTATRALAAPESTRPAALVLAGVSEELALGEEV